MREIFRMVCGFGLLTACSALAQGSQTGVTRTANVASLAELEAAATSTFPDGVWRLTYGNGNSAPPLFYVPSASACSVNAGAGDNGSQVRSMDRKCWLAQFPADGLDAREFGCSSGASDNTSCVNAAMAAVKNLFSAGGTVIFSGGIFPFTGNPSFLFPRGKFCLSIVGAGQDATVLSWAGASGGMTLTGVDKNNCFHFRNLSFYTGATNGGTAITLNQTGGASSPEFSLPSDFLNVTISGADGPNGTDYWTTAVDVEAWSGINFTNFQFGGSGAHQGDGVGLAGTSANVGVVYNFVNASFFGGRYGLIYGNYIQGVSITTSNFTNNLVGINETGTIAVSQLSITGSQFDAVNDDIDITTMAALGISNNLFFVKANHVGIRINASALYLTSIFGNQFTGENNGDAGIHVVANNGPGAIIGNAFSQLASGILLDRGATNWLVHYNTFNAAGFTNKGSGTLLQAVGTWTPVLKGSTSAGSPTYEQQTGNYSINGNQVIITFNVSTSALGNPAGNMLIGGLPRSQPITNASHCSISAISGVSLDSGYSWMGGAVNAGDDNITLLENGSAKNSSTVSVSNFAAAMMLSGFCVIGF